MNSDFQSALATCQRGEWMATLSQQPPDASSMSVQASLLQEGRPMEPYTSCSTRKLFRSVFSELLAGIEPLRSAHKVVELGCGQLDSTGRSFVSSLLPDRLAKRVLHVDQNPRCKELCQDAHFSAVSIDELSQKLGEASFDVALACTALSAVRAGLLGKGLKEIYATLQPGGVLVSIADLQPYFNTLSDQALLRNEVVFPDLRGEDRRIHGIQVVARDVLTRFVADASSKLTQDGRAFLSRYLAHRPLATETFVADASISRDEASVELAYRIGNWVRTLGLPGLRSISLWEDYLARLCDGLDEAGFEIRQFRFLQVSDIVKDESWKPGQPNYLCYANGLIQRHQVFVLSPQRVYLAVRLHFVVAQKLGV